VTAPPYEMTLSLNVLNHLGINLYSNVPAVLAETVANAWDADATEVSITLDQAGDRIVIADTGLGMTRDDVNGKFLHVGYRKRENEPPRTPRFGREPMGRKGIGKLSLLSIAENILIETVKDGEHNGFQMRVADIERAIKEHENVYQPEPVQVTPGDLAVGTRITLSRIKKRFPQAAAALRRRLARRFSVIGPGFDIRVNGAEVTVADRDYLDKVQYLWTFGAEGEDGSEFAVRCSKLDEHEHRSGETGVGVVRGWIGSVHAAGQLKDEFADTLNRITIMVRGKVAQEDILDEFAEGGVYSKYLIGELEAGFLDRDDQPDIATSSRQSIIEDDPRYQALSAFVQVQLKHAQSRWTDWRNRAGESRAAEIPAIKEWLSKLAPDQRSKARNLFGKINQLPLDDAERRRLFRHGVIAFESFRYKESLDALDAISVESIPALAQIFNDLDQIEATLYHQIVRERLQVIRALEEKVEEDARERVIQQHLFEHLWLLDPSWERATDTPYMEQQVRSVFGDLEAGLTDDEKAGRLDIKYKTYSGKHVVIELKRAERVVGTYELGAQVQKYRSAIMKILEEQGRPHEPFEFICIVGRRPRDWADPNGRETSERILEPLNARIVMYQELLQNAHGAYKAYLDRSEQAGRIYDLIRAIDPD